MAYMDTGLKMYFQPQQIGYRNEQMLRRNIHTEIDDQNKTPPWSKNIPQKETARTTTEQ